MQYLNQFYILFQQIPKILLTYAKKKSNIIQNFKLRVGKFWGNFSIVMKCTGWAY